MNSEKEAGERDVIVRDVTAKKEMGRTEVEERRHR